MKKVAVVQMCSGDNPYENLDLVNSFVLEAASMGAELICFPENVFYRGPKAKNGWSREEIILNFSETGDLLATNEFSKALLDCMGEWPIAVSLGSVLQKSETDALPYNSHYYFSPKHGHTLYQKIHLFQFSGETAFYKESRDYLAGKNLCTAFLGKEKIGISICFDLRFPEMFRRLTLDRGCTSLLIPAAFALETGKVHWHSLLKARAIENQCAVFASAQSGSHVDSRGQACKCYGHALAINHWGEILWEGPTDGDAMGIVDWDTEGQQKMRERLPVLTDARLWNDAE